MIDALPDIAGTADPQRRRLTLLAAGTGGVGLVATAVPFVASFAPSERARALGTAVTVSIDGLAETSLSTVEWRGKPVWILRRSPAQLQHLTAPTHQGLLVDPASRRAEQQPAYAVNPQRSIRPETGVLVALCTHLGCIPSYRPQPGAADIGPDWPGGFFCPCHGSRFDLAGRVFRNVPAPTNLEVPPHRYIADSLIEIGIDTTST
ncbi:MAG: ubiquinol-cytochrome c reductase iron-sulfur subunit [Burkholderiaceae bacterium]|nr:ubiquinol-cytochrome c reductase iron-sulfur subunit [Burkholderiaceae bacterium]